MSKIRPEHNWLKITALCGVIAGVAIILFSIYLSPTFVANNMSPDGILAPRTILLINILRIGLIIVGIVFLLLTLLLLSKPHLFELLIIKLDIKNTYLGVGIWLFSIITLIFSMPNVVNSINIFLKIEKHDEHALRLKFHNWYRKQHMIMEFIENNIPNNAPLLIKGKPTCFFAYYLAPRQIYQYSDAFAENLTIENRKFYIVDMLRDKKRRIIKWSIIEKPSGKIIIQKKDKSIH